MRPVFDLQKLHGLLKDFYTLTRMRIVVYDEQFRELSSYPEQRAGICRLIRANYRADEACMQCDRAACRAASRQNNPYIYACHAGMTEAISPLRVNSVIVGYLSFGHLFAFDTYEQGWNTVWKQTRQYGLAEETIAQACRELPLISQAYILSAAHILHAVATLLVMERMATLRQDGLEARLDQYLTEHFAEPVRAETLCDILYIGKTKLYKLLQENYGCGLTEHIRRLRMEKARQLLAEQPELTVGEVAAACGYSDYNYFIAVFSSVEGVPPKRYQQRCLARGSKQS